MAPWVTPIMLNEGKPSTEAMLTQAGSRVLGLRGLGFRGFRGFRVYRV